MVSRRATLQSQAEKVSRNWAEESGMRQFIAVSKSFGHRHRWFLSSSLQNPTFLEPGQLGKKQIRLEVPLIRVPPKETPVDSEVGLMDADSETVTVSVTGVVGEDANLSPYPRPAALPTLSSDGTEGLPKTKKRKVMFADE